VEATYDLVKTMRASVLVLGPVLAQEGRCPRLPARGCAIGDRPIDLHLTPSRRWGRDQGRARLRRGQGQAKRLRGAEINFDTVTVTGTENIMMAASLAEGETVIRNAACEPEIVDLAELLVKRRAHPGRGRVHHPHRRRGSPAWRQHTVIPDRIETGTFVAAVAMAGGDIEIRNCNPAHLRPVLDKFRETGVRIEEGPDNLRVRAPRTVKPSDVTTNPHPGFPTDMQAQYMALMTMAMADAYIAGFKIRYVYDLWRPVTAIREGA
jgi:UDP-N-acetylglucosamine 1-carboxyvinyltransferase